MHLSGRHRLNPQTKSTSTLVYSSERNSPRTPKTRFKLDSEKKRENPRMTVTIRRTRTSSPHRPNSRSESDNPDIMQRKHSAKVGAANENSSADGNINTHANSNGNKNRDTPVGSEREPLLTRDSTQDQDTSAAFNGITGSRDESEPPQEREIRSDYLDPSRPPLCGEACRLNIGGKQFRLRLKTVRHRFASVTQKAFLHTFVTDCW